MFPNIQKTGLFATPESSEHLQEWIEKHRPEDKISLYTVAGMTTNLMVDMIEKDRNKSMSFRYLKPLIAELKLYDGMDKDLAIDRVLTCSDNFGLIHNAVRELLKEAIKVGL